MPPIIYNLGMLAGNTWNQHATAVGQIYYANVATPQQSQYNIPVGWEDHAADTWAADNSKTWPQWRNQRTGRVVLHDPHPPRPQNYLEAQNVATHLRLVEQTPDSPENLYRRPMGAILRFLFPEDQGYDVTQEEVALNNGKANFVVFKILCRPGGSTYAYDFCVVESKKIGITWGSSEDQCREYCTDIQNNSHQTYRMIQIGLELRFYKYSHGNLAPLSGRLHIRGDVQTITQWAEYIKNNPISLV